MQSSQKAVNLSVRRQGSEDAGRNTGNLAGVDYFSGPLWLKGPKNGSFNLVRTPAWNTVRRININVPLRVSL